MKLRYLALALPLLALTVPARADFPNFAFAYEPRTMAKGELELESYSTASVRYDWLADKHTYGWIHQVELEYGVTDRFDVAMYQVFSADQWNGLKLRARYRPVDYGVLPVDVMLYGEVIFGRGGEFAVEEKLVVGKIIGKVALTLDSTLEQENLFGDREYKWNEAIGVGYKVAPQVTAGLEAQARMGWERKPTYTAAAGTKLAFADPAFYAGPTLSFVTEKFFWNVNFSTRASDDDNDPKYLFRIKMGFPL